MYSSVVFMLIGIPGAGKSTFRQIMLKDLPVVDPDEMDINEMAELCGSYSFIDTCQAARKKCERYAKRNVNFIYDVINTDKQERKQMITMFHENETKVIGIFINTPLEVALARNALRSNPVNEDVIRERFEELNGIDIKEFDMFYEIRNY